MKLIAAGEFTIYKKGLKSFVDNETICSIKDDSLPFKVLPINPEFRSGPDEARKHVSE